MVPNTKEIITYMFCETIQNFLFILEKENNRRINTIDLHIILNDYHEHGPWAISVTQERIIMINRS